MADLETTDNSTPDGGDGEVAAAQAFFEKAAEGAGIDVDAAESEPAPRRQDADWQARPAPERPAAPESTVDATEAFLRRRNEARQQRVFESIAALEGRQAPAAAPTPPPAAAAGPADPEPDKEADYFSWVAWNQRQLEKTILGALDERLRPILSAHEEAEAARAIQEQQREQMAQRARVMGEQREIARVAEETYASTQEGQGFMDRILAHVGDPGHPGDPTRGVPAREPMDGAVSIAFQYALGIPAHQARELAVRHYHGMQMLALSNNVNPAVAMDRFVRAELMASAELLGFDLVPKQGQGYGGQPQQYQQPAAPRQQSAAQRRVASLKTSIAGAGAITGSPVGGRAAAGGESLSQLAASSGGQISPSQLRDYAKRKYGNDNASALSRVNKELLALAAEAEA